MHSSASRRTTCCRLPVMSKASLKSIAMKLVFCESSGESSQPPPTTHSEQKCEYVAYLLAVEIVVQRPIYQEVAGRHRNLHLHLVMYVCMLKSPHQIGSNDDRSTASKRMSR